MRQNDWTGNEAQEGAMHHVRADRVQHGEYDPDLIEYRLASRKGNDPAEWPEDLRVRQILNDLTTSLPADAVHPHE